MRGGRRASGRRAAARPGKEGIGAAMRDGQGDTRRNARAPKSVYRRGGHVAGKEVESRARRLEARPGFGFHRDLTGGSGGGVVHPGAAPQ
jgi:hypothetical protein